jgi:hypothetical protein
VDLSISRDHTSIVVVAKHHTGRVRLCDVRDWSPKDTGGRIDLAEVESVCWELQHRWRPRWFIDNYQAEMLGQRLRVRGALVEMVTFVGRSLMDMAAAVLESFKNRVVDLYREERLLADLRRLRLKESPGGYRLDSPRTQAGHGDIATAFALALFGARKGYVPPPVNLDAAVVLCDGRRDPCDPAAGSWQPAPFIHPGTRNRTGALGYGAEGPDFWR